MNEIHLDVKNKATDFDKITTVTAAGSFMISVEKLHTMFRVLRARQRSSTMYDPFH